MSTRFGTHTRAARRRWDPPRGGGEVDGPRPDPDDLDLTRLFKNAFARFEKALNAVFGVNQSSTDPGITREHNRASSLA